MNSLSWLLYFAAVFPQIQVVLSLLASALILFCWSAIVYRTKWIAPAGFASVLIALIAAAIPSEKAVYIFTTVHDTKEAADKWADFEKRNNAPRRACVKVEFEEGEGL